MEAWRDINLQLSFVCYGRNHREARICFLKPEVTELKETIAGTNKKKENKARNVWFLPLK